MICRDLDKSYAIILEEYLLELCVSPFLTLLDFLARQRILQHKKEKEKKCDYVSSCCNPFLDPHKNKKIKRKNQNSVDNVPPMCMPLPETLRSGE